MRRIPVFVTIGFLAGLGAGFFARSVTGKYQRENNHTTDLAAIQKLHAKDIEVTLSQDPQGLLDIWTDDAVRVLPGKPPVIGKQAIGADNATGRAEYPDYKVLSYEPDYTNIHISGDTAWEWGEFEAKLRVSAEGEPISLQFKNVLRVLRRQGDGSWKFALFILKE